MEEGRASVTATVAAMMRAAHPVLDSTPYIFKDDLAASLAGFSDTASLNAAVAGIREQLGLKIPPELLDPLLQSMRVTPAVRARYAEDMLAAAIKRGVSQYVVLGAGLDSFAYTRNLVGSLNIFEVDYPTTQEQKRTKLQELHIDLPSNLTFVPIDFEKQLILEVLETARFDPGKPAFFSWLGVTFFLTDEAFESTLRQVASAAKGSEIIFDYVLEPALFDDEHKKIFEYIVALGIENGETPGYCYVPEDLSVRLKIAGFSEIWHLTPDDVDKDYFAGRTDGLRATRIFQYIRAIV